MGRDMDSVLLGESQGQLRMCTDILAMVGLIVKVTPAEDPFASRS